MEGRRETWLHDKGMQVFSLFHPDNPILSVDVFTHHPIEFDGLHDRSETCDVGGVSVRVASIPDLIFLWVMEVFLGLRARREGLP